MSTEEQRAKQREAVKAHYQRYPLKPVWYGILMRTGHVRGERPYMLSRYRDRGIDVCEEWLDYDVFEAWCYANGWKKGLQIDKIDNNLGYSPDNCRFVTRKENCRNKSNNRIVEYHGERMCLAEAVERFSPPGVTYRVVSKRLNQHKWPLERALTQPWSRGPLGKKSQGTAAS